MANNTQNTTITGLPATQTAWNLTTGDTVVVDVRQADVPANVANLASESHISIMVTTWKADATTGAPILANGRKIGPPAKSHTILTSAIAEGSVNLTNELTTVVTDAVSRAADWFAVYPLMLALQQKSASAPAV